MKETKMQGTWRQTVATPHMGLRVLEPTKLARSDFLACYLIDVPVFIRPTKVGCIMVWRGSCIH